MLYEVSLKRKDTINGETKEVKAIKKTKFIEVLI